MRCKAFSKNHSNHNSYEKHRQCSIVVVPYINISIVVVTFKFVLMAEKLHIKYDYF